jgi:hypothetical protein
MGLLSKAAAKIKVSGDLPRGDPAVESAAAPDGGWGPEGEFPVEPPPEYALVHGLPGALKNEIIRYCNTFTSVNGIILAYPPNYDEKKEGESFCNQVNRMTAALGTAIPLSARYSLVLFSNTVDRELLAHRLSRSLETEVPVVFQADNVNAVVEYIRPFL